MYQTEKKHHDDDEWKRSLVDDPSIGFRSLTSLQKEEKERRNSKLLRKLFALLLFIGITGFGFSYFYDSDHHQVDANQAENARKLSMFSGIIAAYKRCRECRCWRDADNLSMSAADIERMQKLLHDLNAVRPNDAIIVTETFQRSPSLHTTLNIQIGGREILRWEFPTVEHKQFFFSSLEAKRLFEAIDERRLSNLTTIGWNDNATPSIWQPDLKDAEKENRIKCEKLINDRLKDGHLWQTITEFYPHHA